MVEREGVGEGREGSGRQNGLVMGFRIWVSIIIGSYNYRSIDDQLFST